MTCTVEGCGSGSDVRHGMCGKHRYRMRLYGSPFITKNNPPGVGFDALGYRATQVNGVKKFDHVRIAESALGRQLPTGSVVHHADGTRNNNLNANLVICPSKAYHNLLHARIDAMKASGDPSKRKCRHCGEYDSLKNLRYCKAGTTTTYWHNSCSNEYNKQRRERNNNAVLSGC